MIRQEKLDQVVLDAIAEALRCRQPRRGASAARAAAPRGGDPRLLGRDIPRTRQILRRLLVGRLECTAFNKGGRRGYRFTGQGSYAELLPGKLRSTLVVTPAGFDRFRLTVPLCGVYRRAA